MIDRKQELNNAIRENLYRTTDTEYDKKVVDLLRELIEIDLASNNIEPFGISQSITVGIEKGVISKDLELIPAEVMLKFEEYIKEKGNIVGLATIGALPLKDKYLITDVNGVYLESYEIMFARVVLGLHVLEDYTDHDRLLELYIKAYDLYHGLYFMSSTPTLFNSASPRHQLSSCYISTVTDSIAGIFGTLTDNAHLSKYAGGIGFDFNNVRATGAHVSDTNGSSLGIIPFLKIYNDTALAVNQGGKRVGSFCAYLEPWHYDIEEFLNLRKNNGDDRRRTHDMNTALWIPDLFMERVYDLADWTLFSPEETEGLHSLVGEEFKAKYIELEEKAKRGELRLSKTIKALDLWKKMLQSLRETGHPWITFKDTGNIVYPNQHEGVINSSNLCTEIFLHTNKDEIAVCNLGSINLKNFYDGSDNVAGIDIDKLADVINTAVRMLDNVIDVNFYPVDKAKASNSKHRPIGLGVMGFHELLFKNGIAYADTEKSVEIASFIAEHISFFATKASIELAKERGHYSSYQGSLWDNDILPVDRYRLLEEYKLNQGHPYFFDAQHSALDWDSLRADLHNYGIRNSNITAIAPTASISNICNTTQSLAPVYQNYYTKANFVGEFPIENKYLNDHLDSLGLLKPLTPYLNTHEGNIQDHPSIPSDVKRLYRTAFDINPNDVIDVSAAFQRWYDQGISTTLFVQEPTGPRLSKLYKRAWEAGLKSTYYLRTRSATSVKDETISEDEPKVCSILDPECESCQ